MSYTVKEITRTKEWGEGDKRTIYFDFKAEGEPATINIGRKPGNELRVGEVLEGTLGPEDEYGVRKFVKATSFGGSRVEDPAKARAIQRMAAHKSAVGLIHAKAAAGLATEADFVPSKIAALADWFSADTDKARAA